MDEKKTAESLDQVFAAGDAWLRKHGFVTSIAHNSIVTNLYVNFPKVRYLEYFLPEDSSRRKVWVTLYIPFWKLLFTKREVLIDDVIAFLREYLDGYDIQVELKRYKPGVEKSDEVPIQAVNHVSEPVPEQLQPAAEPPAPTDGPGVSDGSQPVDPAVPTGGEHPSGDPAPQPEPRDVGTVPSGDSD